MSFEAFTLSLPLAVESYSGEIEDLREKAARADSLEETLNAALEANAGLLRQKDGLRAHLAAVQQAAVRDMHAMQQRMLRGAHRYSSRRLQGRPLWGFVKDVIGLGSTSAVALCRSFGWDPDQPASEPLPE